MRRNLETWLHLLPAALRRRGPAGNSDAARARHATGNGIGFGTPTGGPAAAPASPNSLSTRRGGRRLRGRGGRAFDNR